MQKTYLYLMVCVIGAMSLASCSEDSISPDAGGDGDSTTEVPLAQVAKPKPNPWLAQEEYSITQDVYKRQRTPSPAVRRKLVQGGRGEVGARHKERTYSTNKKTHQNGTTGCIKYQYFVSLYGNKILSLQH